LFRESYRHICPHIPHIIHSPTASRVYTNRQFDAVGKSNLEIKFVFTMISCFRRNVKDIFVLLGCYTAWTGRQSSTFWDTLSR